MAAPQRIGVLALQAQLEQGEQVTIIDVREPDEYRTLHAAGALLLPLGKVSTESVVERLAAADRTADTRLYFICHSGNRAAEACKRTLDRFPAGTVIEGGTLAWAQAGLPVHFGDQP
ncbi:MAG: rhodanese-like domain-containing protein [Gammaproteobacteria bacterium]